MKDIILFITLILILFSCDGPYKNCPEHYFSEEFKANVIFNPGSYWIYRDTINDLIDSVYLDLQTFEFIERCDYHGEPTELLFQSYYSSLFYPNGCSIYSHATVPVFEKRYIGFYYDPPTTIEGYEYLTMDSIFINGICFYNITMFSKDNYKYYWSKNIGLIKKEFPFPDDNGTIYKFDLINYHLN
ncbi:MAG TPA: hypothetical protein PKN32_03005 [Bacteroidales bacterium]|nr:hypothetical protein [Bacteroidales bacterium]